MRRMAYSRTRATEADVESAKARILEAAPVGCQGCPALDIRAEMLAQVVVENATHPGRLASPSTRGFQVSLERQMDGMTRGCVGQTAVAAAAEAGLVCHSLLENAG